MIETHTTFDEAARDPVAFARMINFKPRPYQEVFLRDRSLFKINRMTRQAGKTKTGAVNVLWNAITVDQNFPQFIKSGDVSARIVLVSGGRQSKNVIRNIKNVIGNGIDVLKPLIRHTGANEIRIDMLSGEGTTSIETLPVGRDGQFILGESPYMVYIEEAGALTSKVYGSILAPMVTATGGSIILNGTPQGIPRSIQLMKLCAGSTMIQGHPTDNKFAVDVEGNPPPGRIAVDVNPFTQHYLSGPELKRLGEEAGEVWVTKEMEAIWATLTEVQYQQEVMALFVTSSAQLYDPVTVHSAWVESPTIPPGAKRLLSVDISGEGVDQTILSDIAYEPETSQSWLVSQWESTDPTYTELLGMLKEWESKNTVYDKDSMPVEVPIIVIDSTGIGAVPARQARGIGLNVRTCNWSGRRSAIYNSGVLALREGRAHLHPGDRDKFLIGQLLNMESGLTPSGRQEITCMGLDDRAASWAQGMYAIEKLRAGGEVTLVAAGKRI